MKEIRPGDTVEVEYSPYCHLATAVVKTPVREIPSLIHTEGGKTTTGYHIPFVFIKTVGAYSPLKKVHSLVKRAEQEELPF